MSQPPLQILRDSAVAAHASSAQPAWLFSCDGSRLLFANATGAKMLGIGAHRDAGIFAVPGDLAARIARSAATLRADGRPRLERLRGLGAVFGQPLTCTCARIESNAGPALLVAATEPTGTAPTLRERARYLLDGNGAAAAFGADGTIVYATADASDRTGKLMSLRDLDGGIETLHLGSGADTLVIALFPANSQTITSRPSGSVATAQPELLDLSPIAEAITAMTKVPPHRNGHDGAAPELAAAAAARNETESEPSDRRNPLRFFWETDAENRFTIGTEAFLTLAGQRTRNLLGRFWGEIAAKLALDPEGRVTHALVSRDTWSGIDVNWPVSDHSITVTLSGIPVFDRDRIFRGYRGLGVWYGGAQAGDEEPRASSALAHTPEDEPVSTAVTAPPMQDLAAASSERGAVPDDEPAAAQIAAEAQRAPLQTENVVPFPLAPAEPKAPALNPAERTAFVDLGSRLASRLKSADELARGLIDKTDPREDPPYIPPAAIAAPQTQIHTEPHALPVPVTDDGDGLAAQRAVLDTLPIGLLIYRGADFIYANPAFLRFSGHASLSVFSEAGGLDSMFVEFEGAADDQGRRHLRIATSDRAPALAGHLVTIPVDGENAMLLTLQAAAERIAPDATVAELAALLELATDGVVTLDRDGAIVTANAPAEKLFGYETGGLTGRAFSELLAPESERLARASIARLFSGDISIAEQGRDLIGRKRHGGLFPLQLTLGRANSEGTRFHALFRDMTRWTDTEREMSAARQQAEKASAAKSEFLAKISHEMRTPLNAIIGFSEVMMEERFGPLGNERYRDYLKDIAASGAHLVSLLNDLLDLSKIEAGKMELSPERIDINEITQQSVAIMQAQANRARVIVRTALSMNIPGVIADARSIRQIVLNLLSNSIKFTDAGGQVIVSTAANDRGEIVLRVRDTGIGMSEKDIEAALQPFRQLTTPPRTDANGTGLGLPLTKALVEANRGRFSIKSAVNAGTLVEVVFPAAPGPGQ